MSNLTTEQKIMKPEIKEIVCPEVREMLYNMNSRKLSEVLARFNRI